MKLVQAQVKLFQNIVDSTRVEIQPDVTCFVGKNGSGKTAFLQTLYRLNPAYESEQSFDLVNNYPRWRVSTDLRAGDITKAVPIEAVFALDSDDIATLEKETLPTQTPQPCNSAGACASVLHNRL